jgi:hypothetical protein
VKKTGFLTIEDVRGLVRDNSPKESMEARGEVYALEPELLILIDTRTNYKIFIAGDNVYTREELFDHYPFERFKVLPEEIFSQQEIGVFPAKKHAMNPDEFEYVARDAGDKTVEFVMVEDMVGQATRPKYQAQRAPVRVVKTKIYIGREAWDNFSLLYRFGKAVGKIVHAQIEGGREAFNPLMLLAPAQAAPGPKLLTNGDLEKEMAERVRAAEEHAKQAAAEVQKIREAAEAEKKRLEEQFRKDIERIEAMIDRKRSRRDTKQREAPNAKKIGKTEVKSANASFETKEDLTQADSVAI